MGDSKRISQAMKHSALHAGRIRKASLCLSLSLVLWLPVSGALLAEGSLGKDYCLPPVGHDQHEHIDAIPNYNSYVGMRTIADGVGDRGLETGGVGNPTCWRVGSIGVFINDSNQVEIGWIKSNVTEPIICQPANDKYYLLTAWTYAGTFYCIDNGTIGFGSGTFHDEDVHRDAALPGVWDYFSDGNIVTSVDFGVTYSGQPETNGERGNGAAGDSAWVNFEGNQFKQGGSWHHWTYASSTIVCYFDNSTDFDSIPTNSPNSFLVNTPGPTCCPSVLCNPG